MFVKDMHIYIMQGLQAMNSNMYRGFSPEQIDIALNKAMRVKFDELYLGKKGNINFEASKKRRSDLSNLVVDNYPLDVIVPCTPLKKPLRVYNNDDSKPTQFRCVLPDDYAILERVRPRLFYNDCGTISYSMNILTRSVAIIPFITDPDVLGGSNVSSVEINFPDDNSVQTTYTVTSLFGYPSWSDYTFPQDAEDFLYHLILAVNTQLSELGTGYDHIRLQWEAYNGIFRSGCVIASSTLPFGKSHTFSISLGGMNNVHVSSFSPDVVYGVISPDTSSGSFRYARTREVSYVDIEEMLLNSFHCPNSEKVLINEHQKHIEIYADGESIPDSLMITYIRRPKRISFALNQGCELNPGLHENICDLAISFIKGVEGHPNYQNIMLESYKGD